VRLTATAARLQASPLFNITTRRAARDATDSVGSNVSAAANKAPTTCGDDHYNESPTGRITSAQQMAQRGPAAVSDPHSSMSTVMKPTTFVRASSANEQ